MREGKASTSTESSPPNVNKETGVVHPGMMGDGTEEQNLNERGNPAARIKKDEVEAAFEKPGAEKS